MENGNQPAFAAMNEQDVFYGLTKREYFAGLAMQGLLSNPEWMKEYKGEKYLIQKDIAVKLSIEYSDELLKHLNT